MKDRKAAKRRHQRELEEREEVKRLCSSYAPELLKEIPRKGRGLQSQEDAEKLKLLRLQLELLASEAASNSDIDSLTSTTSYHPSTPPDTETSNSHSSTPDSSSSTPNYSDSPEEFDFPVINGIVGHRADSNSAVSYRVYWGPEESNKDNGSWLSKRRIYELPNGAQTLIAYLRCRLQFTSAGFFDIPSPTTPSQTPTEALPQRRSERPQPKLLAKTDTDREKDWLQTQLNRAETTVRNRSVAKVREEGRLLRQDKQKIKAEKRLKRLARFYVRTAAFGFWEEEKTLKACSGVCQSRDLPPPTKDMLVRMKYMHRTRDEHTFENRPAMTVWWNIRAKRLKPAFQTLEFVSPCQAEADAWAAAVVEHEEIEKLKWYLEWNKTSKFPEPLLRKEKGKREMVDLDRDIRTKLGVFDFSRVYFDKEKGTSNVAPTGGIAAPAGGDAMRRSSKRTAAKAQRAAKTTTAAAVAAAVGVRLVGATASSSQVPEPRTFEIYVGKRKRMADRRQKRAGRK